MIKGQGTRDKGQGTRDKGQGDGGISLKSRVRPCAPKQVRQLGWSLAQRSWLWWVDVRVTKALLKQLLKVSSLSRAFLALSLLVACTGTDEIGVSTLLVIAYGDGGSADKLALVEDTFFLNLEGSRGEGRFRFLPGSEQPLVEPSITGVVPKVIAYDVLDRNGDRSELVVLSRDETTEPDRSFISFYNLANINPDAPADFAFTDKGTIEITALENPDALTFFPTRVQVSSDGRYVAILNDFASVAATDSIDVIDTSGVPSFVKHLDDSIVSTTFYLEQSSARDRLFFLKQQASGSELAFLDLADLAERDNLEITIPESQSSSNQVVDMNQVLDQLLVLQPSQFTPIAISGSTPQLGEKITGLSSSRKLIPNNSSTLENVLTLSSSNLSVLRSVNVPEDVVFDSTTINATDGSVEPAGGFVYFLATSGDRPLTVFDIQQYNAVFVTWVKSAITAVP
jgi:hypothetical protein